MGKFLHGHQRRGHETPEHMTWRAMLARCLNPNHKGFKHYGGRGITVCDRWRKSFAAFLADMGPRPGGYTLERKDNDGQYSPENCKWATRAEQRRNSRNHRMITIYGESRCLEDWAVFFDVKTDLARNRLNLGWDPERAFTEPVKRPRRAA